MTITLPLFKDQAGDRLPTPLPARSGVRFAPAQEVAASLDRVDVGCTLPYYSGFQQGGNDGALWYFHGDTPCHPVTEEDVIDFLQGMSLNWFRKGFLDQDRRRSSAGFLIGWIAAQLLPLSARTERRVF